METELFLYQIKLSEKNHQYKIGKMFLFQIECINYKGH